MILSIKESGLLFEFDGKQHRTPVKIDISKKNMNQVMQSLKKAGITKFKITNELDQNKKINLEEQIIKSKKEFSKPDLLLLDLLNSRFDKLEEMISKIKNISSYSKMDEDLIKERKIKERKIEEIKVEEFIPEPSSDFEGQIRSIIDSTKIEKEKIENAVNEFDKIKGKGKNGGFKK